MKSNLELAPRLEVSQWFNALDPRTPIELEALRGRVVVIEAFQMLCPGCVMHGIPQAKAIHEAFPANDVTVLGLHSVFEHHDVMTPRALEAFIHEYRLSFPIGVDAKDPNGGPLPLTMQAYGLRGTPSVVVLDRQGRIRLHHFGRLDDLRLGAVLGELRGERYDASATSKAHTNDAARSEKPKGKAEESGLCDDRGCALPNVDAGR